MVFLLNEVILVYSNKTFSIYTHQFLLYLYYLEHESGLDYFESS